MGNSWIWLGIISYSFWMAIAANADASDFHSIIHRTADKKFVDWRNHARWIKRAQFYSYLLWINLILPESRANALLPIA